MPASVSVNESFRGSYYYAGRRWVAFNRVTYLSRNNATTQTALGNVISNRCEEEIWDKACYS